MQSCVLKLKRQFITIQSFLMQSLRPASSKPLPQRQEMNLQENEKLYHKRGENPLFRCLDEESYETVDPDYVTIICLSDTHSKQQHLPALPKADLLIHSGDFTFFGEGFNRFGEYLKKQKHIKWKVVISGNHEYHLDLISTRNFIDKNITDNRFYQQRRSILNQIAKSGAIYLENEGIRLLGYNIYGTPFTPQFRAYQHAFQHQKGEMEQEWEKIPSETDILITHSPALHILDRSKKGIDGGDEQLLKHITDRVNPILHQFGHIHDAFGVLLRDNKTLHVNAAQVESLTPILIRLPKKKQGNKAQVTFIQ